MGKPINFTSPVGRFVSGSLYEPNTTDYLGKPLLARDKVTPRVEYRIGVAIPKTPGATHWAYEQWGAPIWTLANAEFTNGETQRPDFSSKILDGDSAVPNKKGRKPCDNEGYKGNWVIWFSGGFPPKIYNADGSQLITDVDAVKPGYYVQVFGNISDNKPSESPGLYINLSMVALSAYGPEISVGPDVSAAGFGQGVHLPAGATMTPPAQFTPPASTMAPPPPTGVPVYTPPQSPGAPAGMPAPPQVAVTPNPAILTPPTGIPTPPPPQQAPVRQMTAAAQGTYEMYVAQGWTDALLIQHGLMLA